MESELGASLAFVQAASNYSGSSKELRWDELKAKHHLAPTVTREMSGSFYKRVFSFQRVNQHRVSEGRKGRACVHAVEEQTCRILMGLSCMCDSGETIYTSFYRRQVANAPSIILNLCISLVF